LDFDGDGAEKGVYYNVESSCRIIPGAGISGTSALQLNGVSCNIEVPYFQRNEFRQFTFCGWFNRYSSFGDNCEEGLVYNGGSAPSDCYPGSIIITSVDNHHVKGGIVTETGYYEIIHSRVVISITHTVNNNF
jgi:hypothetical protein